MSGARALAALILAFSFLFAPDAAAQTDQTKTPPQVTIAPKASSAVTEGAAAEFTVTRTGDTTNALTVNLRVDDAPRGSDFVASGDEGAKTLEIPTGNASADYSVTTQADNVWELNAPVTVTVEPGAGYDVGSPSSAQRTVNSDDARPSATVEVRYNPPLPPPSCNPVRSAEGCSVEPSYEGQDATFWVTRSPDALAAPLTVGLIIDDAPGSDFVDSGDEFLKFVTIPAWKTGAVYSVPTQADVTDEPSGPVKAQLTTGSHYVIGSPSVAEYWIYDDDDVPVATVTNVNSKASGAACHIDEGGQAFFSIELDKAVEGTTNVNYRLTGPQGSPVQEGTFQVQPARLGGGETDLRLWHLRTHDKVHAPGGVHDYTLTVLPPGKWDGVYEVGSPASVTIQVCDDDPLQSPLAAISDDPLGEDPLDEETPVTPVVSINGYAFVTEGADAVFTVSRTGATTEALSVDLRVAEAPGGDFVASGDEGDKTLSIPAGSASADYTVNTQDDAADEPDGSVTVTILSKSGYTVGSPAAATAAVADNDAPPVGNDGGGGSLGGGGGGNTGGGGAIPPVPGLSSEAPLGGLVLIWGAESDGVDTSGELTLLPDLAADPDGRVYVVSVPHGTPRVRLTPTAGDPDATVSVGPRGGAPVAVESGKPSPEFKLAVGENAIEITVTAEDGTAVATYTVTVTRAPAPPLDASASREHVFPLIADGGGFRTRLFAADASGLDNRCSLILRGAGLDGSRLEAHAALSVSDGGMEIDPGAAFAGVALATGGKGELAFGYAKLVCERPAVARGLLVHEAGGSVAGLANLESARALNRFRFPALPGEAARLGLVLANDGALEASCAAEAEDAAGESVGGGNVAVPAGTAAFRFLDELVPAEDGAAKDAASVSVTCDRPVSALGIPLEGGVFTALSAVDLEVVDPAEGNEEPASRLLLPLVLDGEGFRSRIGAANRSAEANRCELRFFGEARAARFPDAAGAERAGFSGFDLALTGPGDRVALSSHGRHTLAFGHASLDCEGPADFRNLLTLRTRAGLSGLAEILPAAPAREVRFPVVPGLGMALALTNEAEAETACKAELTPAGGGTAKGGESVRIAAGSTAVRFLDDLFALPEGFAGGSVTLSCESGVSAAALPYAGGAFTAVPPLVPGFDTAPE